MSQSTTRRWSRTPLLLCGTALIALGAAPSAFAADSEVSEIIVTGSRIPQPNLTSVSPVQVVDAQEFKLEGKTDVIGLLNNLPQNFQNSQTDFSNNSNPLTGAGGIATADLRGLGPQRTLVLVDGRRLGVGDASTLNPNPAPDLNQIPAQLIDRVEVLTGGASATYGSDAIAGVINFVMKHNFQGVQIDGQIGTAQHDQGDPAGVQGLNRTSGFTLPKDHVWDGRSQDLSFVMGTNGAEGDSNITVYLNYHRQDPITQAQRDYSNCQIKVSANVPFCAGSQNSNFFSEAAGSGPGLNSANGFTVIGKNFVDYDTAPNSGSPGLLFNSSPFQYLQHDDTRYSAGLFSHYQFSKAAEVYADFSFMHDRTITSVAPSGLFLGSGTSPNGGFLVNCNNPLLSAQQAALLCSAGDIASGANADLQIGRRNLEGGPRSSTYDHENYRAVLGMRGEVPGADAWHYDVYGSYYYTSVFQGNYNYLSAARIQNALQVINVNGVPTCISGGACVPYNIFSQGGVTPSQVAYLNSTGTSQGTIEEIIVEGTVTGDLAKYNIKSPWATDGVGVSFGVQNRRQAYRYDPDENELSNDLQGFGGAGTRIHATLGDTEAYGEFRAPLAQDLPFIKDLTLDGGYRYSDYSTGVTADTYKVGLQWSPTPDIRFRASYNRAIRAPNIIELYNPAAVTNTSQLASDPCAPGDSGVAAATLAQCMRTGVTTAQYGNGGSTNRILQCPSGQCAVLNSGNTALSPERANTYSVGFTLTPTFFHGFTASLDYYDIKLANEISTVPLTFVVNECLQTGEPKYCGLIHRAANGGLYGTSVTGAGYVDGTLVNIGAAETSGIDLQATYRMPLSMLHLPEGYGSLEFSLIGSDLMKSTTTPAPGAHTYDCAGLFGPTCQTVAPKWRHTFRTSWASPWNVLFSAQWRYIGSANLETNTSDPTLTNGAFDAFDAKLKAVSYLDLSAIWKVKTGFVVRGGINNVFDKDPQVLDDNVVGAGLPNAYPTYDLVGRQLFLGFTANF